MIRSIFMGTPDFAVPTLHQLIATTAVVGVVTQPDRPAGRGRQLRPSPVKLVAQEAGLDVYQPEKLGDEASLAPIRAWVPDIIVVAAFGQLLRPNLLTLPPAGCLNIRASLLPRWRGASPIQHAILMGDERSGISLMQMDAGLDTGPVYKMASIPLAPDETAATLHDKLAELGGRLLRAHLDDIVSGRLQPQPQDNALATYAPRIQKADGAIDWRRTAAEIDRQIRAMTPWPGAFTSWEGKGLRILSARPVAESGRPGAVFERAGHIFIGAGVGALQIERLQLAGKGAVDAADFVRGRPQFLEAQL